MFTIAVPPQFSHVDTSVKFESVAKAKSSLLKQGLCIQDIELCTFETNAVLDKSLRMKFYDKKKEN